MQPPPRPSLDLLTAGSVGPSWPPEPVRLWTEGQKRGTKYLLGSGAAVPAKVKAKARATRKKAGKRKAAKRGKKTASKRR